MDTELTQICTYALRSVQHAWLPCRPGPGPDAPLIALLTALDTMCAVHAVFFHCYALLSAAERWVGGRGVVQFATIANTHEQARLHCHLHPRRAFTTSLAAAAENLPSP